MPQSSAILEKNSSNYPDLNEEAKKFFVFDCNDSLVSNSEKPIFIKRLDSAEFTLKLKVVKTTQKHIMKL